MKDKKLHNSNLQLQSNNNQNHKYLLNTVFLQLDDPSIDVQK